MKKITLLLFLLLFCTISAQVRISGKVYDELDEPLAGASVYINNTSIGTSTDFEGFFELKVEEGKHDLVISYVGRKTIVYKLDTEKYKNPLKLTLSGYNVLDEIVIKKKLPRSKRKAYLRRFRKVFLGESELGQSCQILNEDAIKFDVDEKNEIFKVQATEPLRIAHKAFGYIIHYELVYFRSTPQSLNYFGYSRYEDIEDEGELREKWLQTRFENYKGTKLHFLRSVLQEKVTEEGYRVESVRRIPNPEFPTYEEIKKAQRTIAKNKGIKRNNYSNSLSVQTDVATAVNTLERAKLSPYITEVIKKDLKLFEYAYLQEDGRIYFEYPDYLRISYDKIPDANFEFKGENPKMLVSMMMLYVPKVYLESNGAFKKPYDVFTAGYWAFQRIGDALPLNYKYDAEWK